MGKNQQRTGFSLIELMVVVVLLAILSSVIVPEMRGTYKHELLRSTTRDIVQTLRMAQTRSVTEGKRHWLRFNDELGEYRVERLEKTPEAGFQLSPAKDGIGIKGKLKKGISVAIENSESDNQDTPSFPQSESAATSDFGLEKSVCFFPDGTSENKTILVSDDDGFQLSIVVNPLTSKVEIVKGARTL